MTTLRRVGPSIFPEVHQLLSKSNHQFPSRAKSEWRRLFDYQWGQEEDFCGYALFDGQKVVGFIGLIFSKRQISGKTERFCNLTSWLVLEDYRDHSLSLIRPVLQLKEHTITDLTPTTVVRRLLKRLDFSELDSKVRLLLTWPPSEKTISPSGLKCIQDSRTIQAELNEKEQKLFLDHWPYQCKSLLVLAKDRHCHIIYKKVDSTRFPHSYIHYISDPGLFSRHSRTIAAAIGRQSGTPLGLIDSRLVSGLSLPFCFDLPFRWPKLYRSSRLKARQIDNLYTELTLLDLNILPTLPGLLKGWLAMARHRLNRKQKGQ